VQRVLETKDELPVVEVHLLEEKGFGGWRVPGWGNGLGLGWVSEVLKGIQT
jgi:hypothetical protein